MNNYQSKYPILHLLIYSLRILSGLSALSILIPLAGLVVAIFDDSASTGVTVLLLIPIGIALLITFCLLLLSEFILLIVNIEYNTRKSKDNTESIEEIKH
jgi:hypothetical protein